MPDHARGESVVFLFDENGGVRDVEAGLVSLTGLLIANKDWPWASESAVK